MLRFIITADDRLGNQADFSWPQLTVALALKGCIFRFMARFDSPDIAHRFLLW